MDDWSIGESSLVELRGSDGPVRFALGLHQRFAFLYVEVTDRNVVYLQPQVAAANGELAADLRYADYVRLVSSSPPYLRELISFATEAPGRLLPTIETASGSNPATLVTAHWQDVAGGYQLEARIPLTALGTNLGLEVHNTASEQQAATISATFAALEPGPLATQLPELSDIAASLVQQPGLRMIVTDSEGWRIANVGKLDSAGQQRAQTSGWLRFAYNALVKPGEAAAFAEPEADGRERQGYIQAALDGRESGSWFRSGESGRAIVAVASPVKDGDTILGSVILQQSTDEILSLTNRTLTRLMNVSVTAMLLVAAGLLGYASWLSRRIRRLSVAAEQALLGDDLKSDLPSAGSTDEVGDLSRSFSSVLRQLGDYNEYLRSLASKLSHELRTPLAIVTSSLENLEHEPLNEASAGYTARARDGAERLRRILSAMSEASRVEELMSQADAESFDLVDVLRSICSAYADAYHERNFVFETTLLDAPMTGAPELLIQMLDKLVDNAVSFSSAGDEIKLQLQSSDADYDISVTNPGPPLPEKMRSQLFDSMVSVREQGTDEHLGLGLYVARLIAEGHGGTLAATNTNDGVRFTATVSARRST
jgi:dedicated sortase system histidine kinase